MTMDALQMPAVILGMAGAVLVAQADAISRLVGFAMWTVANVLWVVWGVKTKNRYIVLLFAFYAATAIWGLANIAVLSV